MLLVLELLLTSPRPGAARTVPVYFLNAEFDHRCHLGLAINLTATNKDREVYQDNKQTDLSLKCKILRTSRYWYSNQHDCVHTTRVLPFPEKVFAVLHLALVAAR